MPGRLEALEFIDNMRILASFSGPQRKQRAVTTRLDGEKMENTLNELLVRGWWPKPLRVEA
jgi:hypothetical protein